MGFFVRIYMRVCKKERKYTWQKNARISCSRKIASIRGKKPHVYRVIILKQMADHTNHAITYTKTLLQTENEGSGLDVATCGVANATRFSSLATNFSLLVARLAPRFCDLVLKFLIEFSTLILLCSCMKPMKSCSFDFGYFIYLLANAK